MYDCQLCNNTPIPEKIYELLDWEAVASDELVICLKCMSSLLKAKDAKVEIKIKKKQAVLVKLVWHDSEE